MNKKQILEQWFDNVYYNGIINMWVFSYKAYNKDYKISDYVLSNIIMNVPKESQKDEIIERLQTY